MNPGVTTIRRVRRQSGIRSIRDTPIARFHRLRPFLRSILDKNLFSRIAESLAKSSPRKARRKIRDSYRTTRRERRQPALFHRSLSVQVFGCPCTNGSLNYKVYHRLKNWKPRSAWQTSVKNFYLSLSYRAMFRHYSMENRLPPTGRENPWKLLNFSRNIYHDRSFLHLTAQSRFTLTKQLDCSGWYETFSRCISAIGCLL